MGQGGRIYTDRITINPPPDAPGDGNVNFYAVEGDPNGVLDADLGDRAWQISSTSKWVCNGGTSWSLDDGGGGGGVIRQFTWDQGAVTNTDEGVYDTFAGAQAAAASAVVDASGGQITLYAVGDADNDITIEDPGAYDMTGITLVGQSSLGTGEQVTVRVPDGTTFTNPAKIANVKLYYTGNDTLITYATGLTGGIFEWGPNTTVSPFGGGVAGTVLAVTGTGTASLYLLDGSSLQGGDAGGLVVDVQDTATLSLYMYSQTNVDGDVLGGIVGTTLYVFREGASVFNDQTTFLGTFTGPAAGDLPYQSTDVTAWAYSSPGGAPVTVNSALDLLVGGRTLFAGPFDPMHATGASQGSLQVTMGATPATSTLVGTGLMANPTVTSPAAALAGSTPALVYGLQTNAAAGSDAWVNYAGDANAFTLDESGTRFIFNFSVNNWTSVRFFLGFIQAVTTPLAADDPAADHVALQFSTARGDTTFQISAKLGGVQDLVDTLVVPVNGDFYQFELIYTGSGKPIVANLWNTGVLVYTANLLDLVAVPVTGTWAGGVRALAASTRSFDILRGWMGQSFDQMAPV